MARVRSPLGLLVEPIEGKHRISFTHRNGFVEQAEQFGKRFAFFWIWKSAAESISNQNIIEEHEVSPNIWLSVGQNP